MLLRKSFNYITKQCAKNVHLARGFASEDKKSEDPPHEEEEDREEREEDREEEEEEWEDDDWEEEEEGGFKFSPLKIIWYSFLGTFGYNYYLNLYTDLPEENIGHIGKLSEGADWVHGYVLSFKSAMVDPPSTKLLHDSNLPPMLKKKTLVIKLDNLLIKKTIQFGKAPEIRLRNKAKPFLNEMFKMYDIIFLSEGRTEDAEMILQALEPTGKFQYAFGNEFMSTNLRGHDLSTRNIAHLNRDLKDVIVLDYSKNDYDLQPENVICIHEFDGLTNDDGLSNASYILKFLASKKVEDVRKELERFGDDPVNGFLARILER